MTAPVVNRRAFLASAAQRASALAAAAAATTVAARVAGAQSGAQGDAQAASGEEMSGEAYKPVRRPPKPGATPKMDAAAINTFERDIACPCPCTLDVYTCRTTMVSCGISPAVHGDIEVLVKGGYSADEIMAAMTDTYGDFILMTPRKQGFNLLAWFAPFSALAIGAVGVGVLLRGWRRNADAARSRVVDAPRPFTVSDAGVDATPEELARLEAALRDDRK